MSSRSATVRKNETAGTMHILTQRHATVAIDSIHVDERNPNQGDLVAIGESIDANGFFGSVLVQEGSGRIIAGAHRWQAAQQAGAAEIPVTYVDVDDERARRIMLADNRTARRGSDDGEKLVALLQELQATPDALSGTGYDGDTLDALLAELGQMQPGLTGDPDAVPEVPDDQEPISRLGDLWRCGEHLVLCGDATVRADVDRVMEEASADLVWTDPPYGVGYEGVWHGPDKVREAVANDTLEGEALVGFLRAAFTNARDVCRPGAAWYVASPAIGWANYAFARVLNELSLWRHTLVWVKDSFVLGRCDYHYRHEAIFYGWCDDGPHYFAADRSQDSVWEIARPATSADHPIMKPVELVARAVRNSSKPGDVVLDPFAGSGTTMAACEQEGRRARLIEVDPRYVDVAVQRWENLTDKQAVREQADDDARVLTS